MHDILTEKLAEHSKYYVDDTDNLLKPPIFPFKSVYYQKSEDSNITENMSTVAYEDNNVTENMSTIAYCDRFICKKCGIRLEGWTKVVIDEYDQGDEGVIYDETHYEYEFKFCPECGAKIIGD